MRVHGNQLDPNVLQMYAMQAAAKTEATREADRTRRKLLNAASALAGEHDDGVDCVVRLSGNGGDEEHAGGQGGESQGGQSQDERARVENGKDLFSDWA
jgi:hypothetical protein